MSTTAQAFDSFLNVITPTDIQRAEISNRAGSARGYLQEAFPSSSDLPFDRSILIGSAARKTIVRPINDIDIMAVFANKDSIFERYRYDSGAFLQRIRAALEAKTTIKQIGARGQAVRLFYTSGAHVDIAPTFKWSGGGYALPSGDGGWMTTDPEAQNVWYSQENTRLNGNLTRLVRLLRRWNAVHSSRFQTYHLEVVATASFSSLSSNYREALKCFFDWAPHHLSVRDPVGHSGLLDSYLTFVSRPSLVSRLSEARSRAQRALDAEAIGDHVEAKRLWRVELGSEFPS